MFGIFAGAYALCGTLQFTVWLFPFSWYRLFCSFPFVNSGAFVFRYRFCFFLELRFDEFLFLAVRSPHGICSLDVALVTFCNNKHSFKPTNKFIPEKISRKPKWVMYVLDMHLLLYIIWCHILFAVPLKRNKVYGLFQIEQIISYPKSIVQKLKTVLQWSFFL